MAHGNKFSRYIYYHSPFVIKNLMVNVYAVTENKRKYGRDYQEYYEFLNNSQWYSKEDI